MVFASQDKFKLRLKILEEGLKSASSLSTKEAEKSEQVNGFQASNRGPKRRSTSHPRASVASIGASVLQQPNPASGVDSARKVIQRNSSMTKFSAGENLVRKNLWAPRSKFFDDRGKENTEGKVNSNGHIHAISPAKADVTEEVKANGHHDIISRTNGNIEDGGEDLVAGFLYDRLQKEVINSRKLIERKDGALIARDDEIKVKNITIRLNICSIAALHIQNECALCSHAVAPKKS